MQWSADFTNDPYDDYNLIVEILCDDEDVAVIKQNGNSLDFVWYPNDKKQTIPVSWLLEILLEVKDRMTQN